jgi:hypothetical protein
MSLMMASEDWKLRDGSRRATPADCLNNFMWLHAEQDHAGRKLRIIKNCQSYPR